MADDEAGWKEFPEKKGWVTKTSLFKQLTRKKWVVFVQWHTVLLPNRRGLSPALPVEGQEFLKKKQKKKRELRRKRRRIVSHTTQ